MPEVVIVGGGLAGLACANRLSRAGVDFQLLEATDRVGGRVRTDVVDRFQLDHGFQFLPCDFPAARQWLDYDLLQLRPFDSQILVRSADRFQPLGHSDPLPTRSPFWARMLEIFRGGPAALPADGMGAIPRHLAERLPRGSLALQRTVVDLRFREEGPSGGGPSGGEVCGVRLSDGSSLDARVVVLATESTAADRLTSQVRGSDEVRFGTPWDSAQTLYFAAGAGALPEAAALPEDCEARCGRILCGDGTSGLIHHVVMLSQVAPEYAPPDSTLISVSLVDAAGELAQTARLADLVRGELGSWFGESVARWTYLRTYAIPYAIPRGEPAEAPDQSTTPLRSVEPFGEAGPIVCGDHRESGTIQGAMNSGLRAAEAARRRLT